MRYAVVIGGLLAVVTFTRTFNSELAGLADEYVSQVAKLLDGLRASPGLASKDLVKLASVKDVYRARVGPYRVILKRSEGAWKVLCVRHRSRVYRSLGPWVQAQKEEADDPFEQVDAPNDGDNRFPITEGRLEAWRVPVRYRRFLVGCSSEDELLGLTQLPFELFSRVVDLLYPAGFEQLEKAPSYVLPPLEALREGWRDSLFGFMLHLDEEQRRLAELHVSTQEEVVKLGRPVLVKGGPGSGKSTVALYRVRKIVETYQNTLFQPPRVLFATYTRALARANKELLRGLLGDIPPHVTVKTLDAVALEVVSRCEGKPTEILGENDEATRRFMAEARVAAGDPNAVARLSDQYLVEEVFQVIEGQGIQSRKEYLDADRKGRKAGLTEAQRKAIWAIYEQFLEKLGTTYRTWEDVRWAAYSLVKVGKHTEKYDHVIIDEAQDLTPNSLRLAVELCRHPGGLYLTADADQTLYQGSFSWQRVHEDLRFSGRNVYLLKKNYRNTRQIAEACRAFLDRFGLEPDPEQAETVKGGGEGPKPRFLYTTPDTEIAQIKQVIHNAMREHRQPVSNVAILVAGDQNRAKARGIEVANGLKASGVLANYMSSGDLRLDARCVKVMSLHTSKGLEFPIVLVVDVHDRVLPRPLPNLPAEERLQERDKDVRLLYVGMSRAMKDLTLFAHEGKASEFVFDLDAELWRLPR